MRRIALTDGQAWDLESEITGYIVDNGYEKKYARRYLKELGAPPDVVVAILARVDNVIAEQNTLEGCPPSRDNAEMYIQSYKHLDKYLNKCFRVVGKRGGKKSYSFNVG